MRGIFFSYSSTTVAILLGASTVSAFLVQNSFHLATTTVPFITGEEQVSTRSTIFTHRMAKNHDPDEIFESSNNNDSNSTYHSSLFYVRSQMLNERITKLRSNMLEIELSRPPNANLSPTEFVTSILEALQDPDHPIPESGYRVLIRSSSPKWLHILRKSVGAPIDATEEMMASALAAALSRPNNQFGILVSAEDAEDYNLTFPWDELDFEDGTCWVMSQLRDPLTGNLFAILGWQLVRRKTDGAWLVDSLDWQDFRDAFRPGIGREEWVRICG